MRQLGYRPDGLIEVLHAAQQAFGYLSTEVLAAVATALGVPLSSVYGVATFYSHFTLRPQGRHVCVVCTGTACHISGSATILAAVHACVAAASVEAVPDETAVLDQRPAVGVGDALGGQHRRADAYFAFGRRSTVPAAERRPPTVSQQSGWR